VKSILSDLILVEKLAVPLLVFWLVLGIFLILAGGCCVKKAKNLELERER
jgi:hypothetical protein